MHEPPKQYSWKQIIGIARQHRRALISAQFIAILATLAAIPTPLLMPLLVDEVLLEKPGALLAAIDAFFPSETGLTPTTYILIVLLITMLLRSLSMVLSVWQTQQFTEISKDVTYQIRRGLLGRLQHISMAEYETLGAGAVTSHFVTDAEAIDNFIGTTLSRFLVAALTIAGVAIILLWMHWPLAVFILLMNPVVIYFTMVMGKKVKRLKKNENKAFEIFQQSLTETLDAIQQIRASNRERHYIMRVLDNARGLRDKSIAYSWKSDAANRASFLIYLLGFEVFRAVSMLMVLFSALTVGQMFAVYAYLWFMMTPMQEVLSIQYAYYSANAALSRINQLLTLQQEPQYPQLVNPFKGQHTVSIRLENIDFAYGDGPKVLNDVSLEIKSGEKIALVGASGGGKSTLVQIILGLYPAQNGQLYFDNIPITQIGMDLVRENISTVLQHPALLNDTVRENLSFGKETSDEHLWQALDIAQLTDVISTLPHGLDTVIGRSGVRLSGGQRQRLAIARMILSRPKVVILDEATSALDTETEFKLHKALQEFLANRTTIIIAHRLSAVKQADRVYVFDGGKIIDQGRHSELINRDGLYRELYGERDQ